MIFLATPSTPAIRAEIVAGTLGQLVTPDVGNLPLPDAVVAIDNGCFPYRDRPDEWDPAPWVRCLARTPPSAKFAVVADVVFNHARTLERWGEWAPIVKHLGHRAAFALQEGGTAADIPEDADALFIGGSTEFKHSPITVEAVDYARSRGMWTHLGRVNSLRRLRWAESLGVNSVDGTFLAHGPDVNLPKLLRWLGQATDPRLFDAVDEHAPG